MTQPWNSGYVADVTYVEGFYAQQSPARMALACLTGNVAVDLPQPDDAACYLELGCGCGSSPSATPLLATIPTAPDAISKSPSCATTRVRPAPS